MSDQDSCLIGSANCGLDQLAFVDNIMQSIKRYGKKGYILPCPQCLCDTMLAVAALLHLEAARIVAATSGRSSVQDQGSDDTFAELARERLKAVAELVPGTAIQFKQGLRSSH
jgi:hypothetical protein